MARTSRVTMERADERPTLEEIAAEAYAIYLAEGARDGRDLDHWLEAERRMIAKGRPSRQPATDVQQADRDGPQDDERLPGDRRAAL
jgi:hypothetical protein